MTPASTLRARRAAKAGVVASISAAMMLATPGMAGAVEPNPGDLEFILRQIQIAEAHRDGNVSGPNAATDVISPLLPEGLRTVTGVFNNLIPGQENFGASDTVFPRALAPFFRQADNLSIDWDGPGPLQVGDPTSYEQTRGIVEDSDPRTISNLIVDMTARNPAAESAFNSTPGSERFDNDNNPATPDLFRIPNRSPDEGLSAPYNAWFTAFGQFFDHGLDLVTKGGGTVMMPLQPDDPLYRPGTPTNFMALTRATNLPGPDGVVGDDPATTAVDESADDVQEHTNTTSPFVDQNQTYGSHPSHQVFLREYELNALADPVSTGRMLNSAINGGGMATWADIKAHVSEFLGIQLVDTDVLNIPLLVADAYGEFTPGPNGYPQIQLEGGGVLEGDPTANGGLGVLVPDNARLTQHAFLDDIAHTAVPNVAGTHDAALLDDHFISGDGRVNENFGLTAVHHVFHTEHNLLVGEIKTLIDAEEVKRPGFKADWELSPGVWDGERLFQAARFMTEMQYQHLVFEEFARKVQPQVDVFAAYQTDIDPAITAEFAHTVYRFGHSMLTEQLRRTSADGQVTEVDLLDAFLNPRAYTADGAGGQLTPDAAAGSLARGMTTQVGSELDEFVTDGVRNNLLGLPLDLGAINIARGRDTGVPSLNSARRQFYAETSHPALAPYSSWTDFKLGIRHPESLVNFVAAYGTHQSVVSATTMADKRAAADLLVNGGAGAPADRLDFLNSTGNVWGSDPNGVTKTGLDDIDFWIGGLAEKQMPFGGLLGTTFNFVFETQMERLQDGDRLYYLTRVAGLNFLTQLEENSFSELVMRTTDAKHLPFDVFSTPDYSFEVANLGTDGPILDDPATVYNETELLLRMPNGTVRFSGPEHVLMGGTGVADHMRTGDGDDTIWGDGGNDRIEGGAGNDSLNGNADDDIITDIFGDDNIKGGTGNDTINAGSGIDLILAGFGKDFVVAGSDPKETFAGEGDDFVVAGDSADVAFGNGGHDWLEGGSQGDALNGEHAEPFFEDDAPSHDVFSGDGGDDEIHTEGGNDIIIQGPGLDFNEGMLGFDWATHRGDSRPGNTDLNNTDLQFPDQTNLFDRFDFVEALSGWDHDDVLRGENSNGDDPARVGHQLTQQAIDLIDGLNQVMGTTNPATVGNVILGGDGGDIIEGRGGNDVIDGDSWLNVQLEAPNPATQDPADTQLVDSMKQLQADVFAGRINPGQIEIVRTIETVPAGSGADGDTAVFSGPEADYTVTRNADRTVTVAHLGGTGADGTDTLRNVELMQFAGNVTVPVFDAVAGNVPASGTVNIVDANGAAVVLPQENDVLTANPDILDQDGFDPAGIVYTWQVGSGANRWEPTGAPGPSLVLGDEHVGKRIRVVATFTDNEAQVESITSEPTAVVANVNDAATGKPALVEAAPYKVRDEVTATMNDVVDEDGRTGATYSYQWQVAGTTPVDINGATGQKFTPTDAHGGRSLQVVVSFTDDKGAREQVTSDPFTVEAIAPDKPTIANVTAGVGSATVEWTAPARNGGSEITGYEVNVLQGSVPVKTVGSLPATQRTLKVDGLTNNEAYSFSVTAINGAGTAVSETFGPVTPGALPAAPATVTTTGGDRSIHVEWAAVVDTLEPITGYLVKVLRGSEVVSEQTVGANATSLDVTGLANGVRYLVQVSATNRIGAGAPAESTVVPATVATAPRNVEARPKVESARVSWTAPADDGGSAVTGYKVQVLDGNGDKVGAPRSSDTTSMFVDGLTNGRTYRFEVWAMNGEGAGAVSAPSNAVTPANRPGRPDIKTPKKGQRGGELTATPRWRAPRHDGGSAITGYRVIALKVTGQRWGSVVDRISSPQLSAARRSYRFVLPEGIYRFRVVARNVIGEGLRSQFSKPREVR